MQGRANYLVLVSVGNGKTNAQGGQPCESAPPLTRRTATRPTPPFCNKVTVEWKAPLKESVVVPKRE